MTQAEALNIINQAAARGQVPSPNSNFTGNGALEYYTGYGDPSLQFNGGAGSSLLMVSEGAEPFSLEIVNTSTSARSFYLSQGLLYTRGSETAGQLCTGTFAAINDVATATSLTASTSNSITIEQFIAFCNENPTFLPLIQVTSNSPTSQLSQTLQYYRQGMIKNEVPTTVPFRKYASGDQYNLQFQDIREPLYIDNTNIIIISVAGSSTLTLQLYPLASKSSASQLRGDVNRAKRTYAGDPAAVMQLDGAQKILVESAVSPANTLNSYR